MLLAFFRVSLGGMKTNVLFNRQPLVQAKTIAQPSALDLKSTFGLWNASLDDAIRYGGDVTRDAIQAMNLRFDRKHIVVDTKVHMLMPGWSPAILGWHTDGAPRDANKNPQGKGEPDTFAQEGDDRFNRYHILVTGTGCLTQYLNKPLSVPIPSEPSGAVYSEMSQFVQAHVKDHPEDVSTFPTCTVMEFDWWDIHTGVIATKNEWRYLIRVCETDYYEPRKDLREVIRLQSQIYSPVNFGW